MLDINKTTEGSKTSIALTGRLDTVTAPDLEKELKDSIDSTTELVLDFNNLDYISSFGAEDYEQTGCHEATECQ